MTPRALHIHCHVGPVNWVAWSVVMVAGTPKCATQLATKESVTTCAGVDCRGITDAHLIVLSTTVSR